jgi:low affinity Fe/Cu permease
MIAKIPYNIIRGIKAMDKIVNKLKSWFWVIGCAFTVAVFFQQLLTLNPRVTDLETRIAGAEGKISAIEIKLDTLIQQGSETHKDVKDIYHLILERHK